MKKAKGGKVMGKSYFEDIPDKENDTIDPDDQGSQTYKEINEDMKSGQALYEKLYNRDKSDNNTKVGKIIKKATGGAMNAKRIANPNMPRPMGGVMMGNGPFGPRNPNGPRKPMGSPSPMSGGIMAAMNSMVNKGRPQQSAAQQNLGTQAYNDYTKAMPRKKGGMAKGNK